MPALQPWALTTKEITGHNEMLPVMKLKGQGHFQYVVGDKQGKEKQEKKEPTQDLRSPGRVGRKGHL